MFEVGNIVKYNGHSFFKSDTRFKERIGEEAVVIRRDFRFNTCVNTIEFKGGEKHECLDICLIDTGKKIKNKKLNLDEDPFGEENWGYVQEQKENEEKFEVGEIVLYTGNRNEYYGQDVVITHIDGKKSYTIKFNDGNHYGCDLKVGGRILLKRKNDKKRILNLEEDPFGEENWGYVQEQNSLNYENLKIGDRVKIKDGTRYAYQAYLNGGIGTGKINNKKIEHSSGTWVKVVWDVSKYEDSYPIKDLILIGDKKRKLNLDEDPFGEEDWGYVDEGYDPRLDEFLIGDVVMINPDFKPKDCIELDYSNRSGGGEGVIRKTKSYPKVWIIVDWKNGKTGAYELEELVKIGDKRIKILNLDEDPFGEEDWGYMKESRHFPMSFNSDRTIIFEDYLKFYNIEELIILLNRYVAGEKIRIYNYNEVYGEYYVEKFSHNYNPKRRRIYMKLKEISGTPIHVGGGGGGYRDGLVLVNKDIPKDLKIGYYKNTKPDIDPFGEEDWGTDMFRYENKMLNYKNYIKESVYSGQLVDVCIHIKNEEEYDELMRILEKAEYRWADNNLPTTKPYDNKYFDVIFIESFNGEKPVLLHSRIGFYLDHKNKYYSHFKYFEFEEFKIFFGSIGKMIKISNLEDDPFGEEDWGWTTIKENFTDEEVEINMKDLLSNYSEGEAVELLNKYCTNKRTKYIRNNNTKVDEIVYIAKYSINHGQIHVRLSDNRVGDPKALIFVDPIGVVFKKRKRKLNLEDDPFGEENWGYLDENKKNNI